MTGATAGDMIEARYNQAADIVPQFPDSNL